MKLSIPSKIVKINLKPLFYSVLAVLVVALAFQNYKLLTAPRPQTAIVTTSAIHTSISASGWLLNPVDYNLTPEYNAKVLEILVQPGAKVEAGQVLIKLDDTELQDKVNSTKNNLDAAIFHKRSVENAPRHDQAAIDQAQSEINAMEIEHNSAKRNLAKAEIKAPVAGKISNVNVFKNQFVNVTNTVIVLEPANSLEAVLEISEYDIRTISAEQNVDLTVIASEGTISGTVKYVNPTGYLKNDTVYYKVGVAIPAAETLMSGMSVDAEIYTYDNDAAITVPATAVTRQGNENIVRIVVEPINMITQDRVVKLGVKAGNEVEILEGLTLGELILTNAPIRK